MSSRVVGSLLGLLLAVMGRPVLLLAQAEPPRLVPELAALAARLAALDPQLAAMRSVAASAKAGARLDPAREPLSLEFEADELSSGRGLADPGQSKLLLSSTLYRGGRVGAMRARAEAAAGIATAGAALTELERTTAIRAVLVGWLVQRGIERRFAAQDSLLALAADLLQARFAVGQARYLDVLRLRTERLRLARERAEAAAAVEAGALALSAVAARDSVAGPMLTAQLASWDARRAWGELRSALPDTPDDRAAPVVERLIGARRRALEAEAADGLARRGLAVTGAVGVQRFVGEDGRATAGPALGLGIALPFSLSGGYAREREVVRLRREADQAGLAADSSAYAVARAQARQAGESARARVRLYDDALLAGAADEREGAVAGFRTGTVSLLELIDFERSLAEAERGRWLAIQDVLAADAALVTSATRSFPPVVRDLAEGAAP